MEQGHFYFLQEKYFQDFKDEDIQTNHETINDKPHGRPCFCAIPDSKHSYFWLIPISSQVKKYERIANVIKKKFGYCDKILFGDVLGKKCAFLIQNMIPVSEKYIEEEYTQNGKPIRVKYAFENELVKTAHNVLKKHKRGIKLIYPDVEAIERILIYQEKMSENSK